MNNPVNPVQGPHLSLVPTVVAQDQAAASPASWPAAEVSSSKAADASAPVRTEVSESEPSTPTAADFRLIIEESDPHHYVYTVVDRRTGDVVNQFPREEVLRLKDQPGYKAGDLYKGAV